MQARTLTYNVEVLDGPQFGTGGQQAAIFDDGFEDGTAALGIQRRSSETLEQWPLPDGA